MWMVALRSDAKHVWEQAPSPISGIAVRDGSLDVIVESPTVASPGRSVKLNICNPRVFWFPPESMRSDALNCLSSGPVFVSPNASKSGTSRMSSPFIGGADRAFDPSIPTCGVNSKPPCWCTTDSKLPTASSPYGNDEDTCSFPVDSGTLVKGAVTPFELSYCFSSQTARSNEAASCSSLAKRSPSLVSVLGIPGILKVSSLFPL